MPCQNPRVRRLQFVTSGSFTEVLLGEKILKQ
jgi:hypothetical protein